MLSFLKLSITATNNVNKTSIINLFVFPKKAKKQTYDKKPNEKKTTKKQTTNLFQK